MVAGRTAHRVSVQSIRQRADLDHAGGWNQSEAINHGRQQHATELELEVVALMLDVSYNELRQRRESNSVQHGQEPRVTRQGRAITQGGEKVKQQKLKWVMLIFALGAVIMLGACKKKVAPPPPPPPPPPAAPTATLSANPDT